MANHKTILTTDRARFHGEVDISGKQKIHGYYDVAGPCLAHYSISRQRETAAFRLRGTISFRGADNAVLRMKGADGKTAEARLHIAMQSTEAEDIKREIAEKAQKLYAKFSGSGKAGSAYIPISQMSFAETVHAYGEEYAQARSPGSGNRRKDRLHDLLDVAAGLAATSCEKVSQRQISELCEQLGDPWYDKIREADMFMAYVAERRKYEQVPNPFAKFREAHARPRNTKHLQSAAVSADVLSRAEQDKVVELVLNNLGEPDYAGIGLLLGTGLEAKRVVALRYGDLHEDSDNKGILIMDYYRPELVGSMHDFSFVLSALAERICLERRAMLVQEGLALDEIAGRFILTNSEKPYRADNLTAACRNILHSCGVGYAQLAGLATNTEGAGVRLLRSTYALRLEEDGGLGKDLGLHQFMTHKRPDSTQGTYYRSFTDVYARRCQAIAHRRIQWWPEKRASKFTSADKEKKVSQTIRLKDGEKTVKATMRIELQAGETIQVTSDYGILTGWHAE